MALAYFAWKFLKQKRRIRRKQDPPKDDLEKAVNVSSYFCRICLNVGSIPIYGVDNDLTTAKSIQLLGDVELDVADEYPKHLCENCYNLLHNAIQFRKLAKNSDSFLRQKKAEVQHSKMPHIKDIAYDFKEDLSNEIVAPKSYSCKLCKINFKTYKEYVSHKTSKQHKQVRIQCTKCQRLLTANLYERHLARHESVSHLVCEVCGKLFRKDNLIRHLQLHSYELPFKCQICPYRGRYVDSLKIHIRTHTGDKPFTCGKCDLHFLTRSNLNRHLLTHKKERPYKCVECDRGFYTKRDLDVHFKSDHVGIKEFGCKMCDNRYGTRKALMRHELRVHKREKMAKGRLPLYLQAEYRKDV